MKYQIVTRDNQLSLEQAVNKMLSSGWRCEGGVCVTYQRDSGSWLYAQAMTREIYAHSL